MTTFRSPDGSSWDVALSHPSHSSAIVTFRSPGGARFDRYAVLNVRAAKDPREQLDEASLARGLDDRELSRLFRRSVPVSSDRPAYIVS